MRTGLFVLYLAALVFLTMALIGCGLQGYLSHPSGAGGQIDCDEQGCTISVQGATSNQGDYEP